MNHALSYEITPIPRYIRIKFGKNYNNSIGNGVFWSVITWSVFHLLFDAVFMRLFKKFRLAYHVRIRLLNSSWCLIFFISNFLYCKYKFNHAPVLLEADPNDPSDNIDYDIMMENTKFTLIYDDTEEDEEEPIPWDFIFMSSYYLHVVIWEILEESFLPLNYFFFSLFLFLCYWYKSVYTAILLMAVVSLVQIMIHLSRLSVALKVKQHSSSSIKRLINGLTGMIFFTTILFIILIDIIIIPVIVGAPLLERILFSNQSFGFFMTFVVLGSWLVSEIYYSPLYRFAYHLKDHKREYPPADCLGSLMECSLFTQRDDVIYHLKMIKMETKERQARIMAKRKPKKGACMLVQTLKCMVAINRKMKQKQQQNQDTFVPYCATNNKQRNDTEKQIKSTIGEDYDDDDYDNEDNDIDDDEEREENDLEEEPEIEATVVSN